jgi:hypothetical protein
MSTYYAVQMNAPHATVPDVLWDVRVPDECVRSEGDTRQFISPKLWVPRLETWTLDTLRMVLHELAAYLPPHDDAEVTILAKTDKPKGRPRPDGQPRPRRFNDHVEFKVSARGWSVYVGTDRNEVENKDGRRDRTWDTGEWTEPMQAVLLDLAAKSPFRLADIRPVDCGPDLEMPSRRDILRGVRLSETKRREELDLKTRIQRILEDDSDDDAAAA